MTTAGAAADWAALDLLSAARRIADARKADEAAAIAAYVAATGVKASAVRALVDEIVAHRRLKATRLIADDWRVKGWMVAVSLASAALMAFGGPYRSLGAATVWLATLPYLLLVTRAQRRADAARG